MFWQDVDEADVRSSVSAAANDESKVTDACTSWARGLREHLQEVRESRGSQRRNLLIASACSGMGTHNFALKDTGDHL
eukprot:3859163-Amphidinium_carterae.1